MNIREQKETDTTQCDTQHFHFIEGQACICPLTKKWYVYNLYVRFIWTVRQNNNNKIKRNACQHFYKLICILMSEIGIWPPSQSERFLAPRCFLYLAGMGYKGCDNSQMEETRKNCQISLGLGLHARSYLVELQWSWERWGSSPELHNKILSMIIRQLGPCWSHPGAFTVPCSLPQSPKKTIGNTLRREGLKSCSACKGGSDGWAVRESGYKSEGCWFDSPTEPNDVVSLGKALHPTCLWENVPVLTVSRSG